MSRDCLRLVVSVSALSLVAAGCSDPTSADGGGITTAGTPGGMNSAMPSSATEGAGESTSGGALEPTGGPNGSAESTGSLSVPTIADSGGTSATAEASRSESPLSSGGDESTGGGAASTAGAPNVEPTSPSATGSGGAGGAEGGAGGARTTDGDSSTDAVSNAGDASASHDVGSGDAASGPLLAFPGAEGFGRNASGGRGGEVVHVTNLDDSGAGSFRDAVSQPNRIVVFDVGGIIHIDSRIVIQSNITVAGQTAPGGGITVYGNGVALNGDSGGGNVILRYVRVRMGKNGDSGKDAVSISLGENYMFDHMSISWGRDGTLDVNGTPIDNLSFQECIVAQGINSSNHSTGGLMQPSGVDGHWSMIRSLYIDNKTRNPKARGRHEFINSVLYNWAEHGYIMGDTTGGESHANVIGNYFIYGPSSNADSHITGTTEYFHLYAADNWLDADKNGILDGGLLTNFKTATLESTPYDYPSGVNAMSAQDALAHVIDHAGASLARDAVDEMLIEQLRSYGTQGQIIDTEDDNDIVGNVGTLASGVPPTDTDRDGMPDGWESTRGLDPNTADDRSDDDGDGYTNVEEYLSCLVAAGGC